MVNLKALDHLVEQHLSFEASCGRAIQDSSSFQLSSDEPTILAAQHLIREYTLCGALDKAVSICESVCPEIIADSQTQLIIRIHKLTELLHHAETVADDGLVAKGAARIEDVKKDAMCEALRYSQTLATFALSAFPEAYTEFTKAMSLFINPEEVKDLSFILAKRRLVADTLVERLGQAKLAYGSKLSLLIRYLGLIHLQFCTPIITRDDPSPPLHAILQRLFDFELAHDATSSPIQWRTGAPADPLRFDTIMSFEEEDVQVLPERVGISRQKAIASLRVANGDVFIALKNELARVVISNSTLQKLVVDFAAARGLDAFSIVPSADVHGSHVAFSTPNYVSRLTKDTARVAVLEDELSENFRAMWCAMKTIREAASSYDDKHQSLSVLHEAVRDTGLLDDDMIQFRLAQRKVAMLAEDGLLEQALHVMRSEMGPIALRNPVFQSELEETSMMVVCTTKEHSIDERDDSELSSNEETLKDIHSNVWKACSLESIMREVYDALQRRHGEPDLAMVIRGLLETHTKWQEVSMFTDRCSASLGIDELCKLEEEEDGDRDTSTVTADSSPSDKPEDKKNSEMEQTILTLMEFLALSRAEALTLIQSHPRNANPQVILESVLRSRGF